MFTRQIEGVVMKFNYIFEVGDLRIQITNIKQALDELRKQHDSMLKLLKEIGRVNEISTYSMPRLAILNKGLTQDDFTDDSNNWIILDSSINADHPQLVIQKECPISTEDQLLLNEFSKIHNYEIINQL